MQYCNTGQDGPSSTGSVLFKGKAHKLFDTSQGCSTIKRARARSAIKLAQSILNRLTVHRPDRQQLTDAPLSGLQPPSVRGGRDERQLVRDLEAGQALDKQLDSTFESPV